MSAPFTQIEIQEEIDYYKDKMRVATRSQEYRYTQQTGSDVDIRRGKLEEIQSALDYWLGLMDKYYPDAFSDGQNQIEFWTVGIQRG